MNKICTNIQQSKKLLKLGIDINTADMYYMYRYWEIDEDTVGSQSDTSVGFNSDIYYGEDNGKTYHYIPAWSLSALLDLLPSSLPLYPEATEEGVKEGKYRSSDLIASKEGYLRKKYDGDYQYRYDGIKVVGDFQSPLDAAFEMVCWLLENKKI